MLNCKAIWVVVGLRRASQSSPWEANEIRVLSHLINLNLRPCFGQGLSLLFNGSLLLIRSRVLACRGNL